MQMRLFLLFLLFAVSHADQNKSDSGPDARVNAFFKLLFEAVSSSPDKVHYITPRFQTAYDQLCAAVPSCRAGLMAIFDEEYEYVESMHYRLARLYKVLDRLQHAKQQRTRLKRIFPLHVKRLMKQRKHAADK